MDDAIADLQRGTRLSSAAMEEDRQLEARRFTAAAAAASVDGLDGGALCSSARDASMVPNLQDL